MNTDRRNQGDNAWIDPESETNWLRDLLPQELPAARILTYDYNTSTVLKASTTGIEQQALNLLKCLKSERVVSLLLQSLPDGCSAPQPIRRAR